MIRSTAPRGRHPTARVAFVAAALAAGAISLAPGTVAAQASTVAPGWLPPPHVAVVEVPERAWAPRPLMIAAIGMGASFDGVGFNDGTHAIPSFFASGGLGDGLVGAELEAFASSGIGRYRFQSPINRLALNAYGVVRPGARARPGDVGYGWRVLRTVGAEFGLGFERDSKSAVSGSRFVAHLGARVELPLTPPGQPSEVRIRLGVSRGLGLFTPTLYGANATANTDVTDSVAETYGALVVVF
jgi:hypothetical protein